MAIYHFSGTIVSRSQGRSSVAAAAYRSANELHDERLDKTYDYTKKQDVVHTEILLPKNAPEFLRDRNTLWNTVEASEKRKDAQLAREFNMALPRELTLEQQIELSREFVTREFVSKGMCADLCIHNDKMKDGQLQPHAHVMLTMRELTENGFGPKVREWNSKENLLHWREAWADITNQHLLIHGHDISIDHRTLVAQGIDLEPQYKIGSKEAEDRLARLADHQRIARENGEKLLENPDIALHAITHQQSTFTEQDLARFVNRHTVDATQFQAVLSSVKASPELAFLGVDVAGKYRFTTQTMLAIETTMMQEVDVLSQRVGHEVAADKTHAAMTSKSLTDEQSLAFQHLTNAGDLKCVVGFAGTGKSYLLGAAREAWEAQGYTVLGATLSGIAAQTLSGSSGIESRTLASRFHYWNKGEQPLTNRTILVIDEAGMIGSRQMARVLAHARAQSSKVVLIGDPEQLQAIEAGAAFRAISERTGYIELMDVRRQREDWQCDATREFATGKTQNALARYDEHQHVHAFQTETQTQEGLISLWNDARITSPETTQIILAYTRREVENLNCMARDKRQALGELGAEHIISTVRGERPLSLNDRIYFLKNDRQLGVMNGTLGTIQAIDNNIMAVRLDEDTNSSRIRTVSFCLDEYNHIDHGYAATIHKGQGVTVDRSYILASRYMDRHSTYVAGTRHRESADIFYNKEMFQSVRQLSDTLSRDQRKDISVDFSITTPEIETNAALKAENKLITQRNNNNHALVLKKSETPVKDEFGRLEAQEKIRQQTQKAQLAEKFKSATGQTPAEAMAKFKTEFEAKHPELAQRSRLGSPSVVQEAITAEKNFMKLYQAVIDSPGQKSLHKPLVKFVMDTFKNETVMDYLAVHKPKLYEKIDMLHDKFKPLELARQKSLELGGREI
jgi:Ti-type conjugative transfer relaxase TraA